MAAPLLIVHGDAEASELISRLLGAVGRSCITASTVEGALEALRGTPFGVVLLSPQVEQGRGHIVLEALAQQPPERRMPVVLLGEGAAGFDHPVVPLPPGEDFVERVLAPERERVLAAAERALNDGREAATRERGRVHALEKHLDDVELQLAVRRADLDRVERELSAAKLGRTRLEANLAAMRAEGAADHASLEQRLAEQVQQNDALGSRLAQLEQDREALERRLAAEQADHQGSAAQVRALEDRLARTQAEHAAALEAADAQLSAAEARVPVLRAEHSAELEEAEARAAASRAEHAAQLATAETRFTDARSAQAAEKERSDRDAATARAAHAAELAALSEQLAQTEAARVAAAQRATDATAALEAERIRARGEHAELEAARTRAAAAERDALKTQERLREAETRSVMKFDAPEAPVSSVPRSGTLGLGELARVGIELWRARADVRLDLAAPAGLRRLWLRRGALVGAVSELPGETLTERARRDGLIDDHQARELRGLNAASLRRQLDELLQRGLLRRSETEGLLLRYVEGVALEAFSEGETTYRLEPDEPELPVPTPPQVRPLAALVAQALRRALPLEGHVALVGGPFSILRARAHTLDLELLGFSAREQRLLDAVDAERPISSLAAATGLTTDRACQALSVAKALGLVELDSDQAVDTEDDAGSLARKFEQVQSSDYFAILGLSREADGNAVRRAQLQLSQQFDPLKFAAHPDPAVLHQAQVVYRHVKDAARALQDDRRRADYARHLL